MKLFRIMFLFVLLIAAIARVNSCPNRNGDTWVIPSLKSLAKHGIMAEPELEAREESMEEPMEEFMEEPMEESM